MSCKKGREKPMLLTIIVEGLALGLLLALF